jgi:alkylhydroperoxidase family enzyme
MARLPPLATDAIAHDGLRDLHRLTGDEMFAVYAHSPEAFGRFLDFYRPLKYGGALPFALKELVRLKIAGLNDCQR